MIFAINLFELECIRQVVKHKDYVINDPKSKDPRTITKIAKGSKLMSKFIVGRGTKINGPITIKNGFCEIGNFSSIGFNVKTIGSNHSLDTACVQVGLCNSFNAQYKRDKDSGVYIGNNVWVGDDVIILPGVKIADGCIVGAGSVVTKSTRPYSIVAGNPAREIRIRGSEERIKEFNDLCFWDKSLHWMESNKIIFSNGYLES